MASTGNADREIPRDRWSEQIAALSGTPRITGRSTKTPITVERIVVTALDLVRNEGFEALTMRRLAALLNTGAASLYAHVRNKAELDDLLIGELCSRVNLPEAEADHWREQFVDVCRQLRDQFLGFPGISRAALAAAPRSLDTVRINEGMMAILLAGGVSPQSAAWAVDASYLYVSAYCLEAAFRQEDGMPGDNRIVHQKDEAARLKMLPEDLFPHMVAYADELTAGAHHERFEFTLGLLLAGLMPPSA